MNNKEAGFTLVELLVTIIVGAMIALSTFLLLTALINSTLIAKKKAVAVTLATNQMEYLKSLPYENLAVQGGSIYATTLLPATTTKTINGVKYTVTTSINYVDDSYDGCFNYASTAQKLLLCRGSVSSSPTNDTNPSDYKIAHVTVKDNSSLQLASVDTQIAGSVAETSMTNGALFVYVIDQSGAPLGGATVNVSNTTLTPVVALGDTTDTNGIAVFYGLPPDGNTDYIISASMTGYSSLTTINASGSLQPTYPNQKILTQQSSYTTLVLKQQGANSLVIETTDTSGAALPNARVYVKGGYKKYTSSADTNYYYDNMSPSDTRPTTDGTGQISLSNLVPGDYIFCGDEGSTGCRVGGTTYYLAAAVPYGGTNSLNPITVPTYDPTNPPGTTFTYSGNEFLQKVRLMLTTNSNLPRAASLSPSDLSLASATLSNFAFTINGRNLFCSSSSSSCATSVNISQGANNYVAACTGSMAGLQLSCTVDFTGIGVGKAQLTISNGGGTLTLPTNPLGGFTIGN